MTKVVKTCETCIKFCKPNPQPVFTFAEVEDFNQTVLINFTSYQPIYGRSNMVDDYFADEFNRYSVAVIVKSKAVCHKEFIKHWISISGAPKKDFQQ